MSLGFENLSLRTLKRQDQKMADLQTAELAKRVEMLERQNLRYRASASAWTVTRTGDGHVR
jgi:hypothetical protein